MRLVYLIILLGLFSCKYEKYEPAASTTPLAECIDGHAKFTLDGKEYEYECEEDEQVRESMRKTMH